jgi:transcriptional regulator with XRE-family HTH domain
MPESSDLRREKIGLLMRRAREMSGRTRKDCAAFLHITQAALAAYEESRREPSLPELEALAHYLRVPVHALLDESVSTALMAPRVNLDVAEIIELRSHIIGARLKQARLNKGLAVKALAAEAGITTAKLAAYELGKRPAPITELERLATALDLSVDVLLDIGIGPLGESQLFQRQHARLDALPPDVREFVCDPQALTTLRAAMRLRQMSNEEVRAAGQALLELSRAL